MQVITCRYPICSSISAKLSSLARSVSSAGASQVVNQEQSLTIGPDGPALFQDFYAGDEAGLLTRPYQAGIDAPATFSDLR
jgi:hypothetical protein